MSVKKINQQEFENAKRNEGLLLLDFYADWCGPCQMLAPTIEQVAAEREDVVVAKINCDDNPEIAMSFGVSSIPTLVVMKDGKVVNTSVGVRPKDAILAML